MNKCLGDATAATVPIAIQDLRIGIDKVQCVRRTSLDPDAAFLISCCDVVAWMHVEHTRGPGYIHLHYTVNGSKRVLKASQRHIAYVYKGGQSSTTKIQFGKRSLHTVTFGDVAVGDQLAVLGSSSAELNLVEVDRVEVGSGLGAYSVLLQDGGSPIVEGALMSMSAVVGAPNDFPSIARRFKQTCFQSANSYFCLGSPGQFGSRYCTRRFPHPCHGLLE